MKNRLQFRVIARLKGETSEITIRECMQHVHLNVYMCASVCVCVDVCVYVCVGVCVCMHVCMCIGVCLCVCPALLYFCVGKKTVHFNEGKGINILLLFTLCFS